MSSDFQTRIMISIGLLVIAVMIPFFVYHIYFLNWPIVCLIALIGASEASFIFHVYRGGDFSIPAHLVAAVHTVGCIFLIYNMGMPVTYWLYPAVLSNFYLLPLRSAVIYNVLATMAGPLLMLSQPEMAVRLFATLTLMNILGYVFSHQVSAQRHELSQLSLIDPLTLAGNRRALDEQLVIVSKLKVRHDWHVSAIMLDIDHFKKINDHFDHHTGDNVLKAIVMLIKERLRQTDTLYRYGGEEFVVLALNTDLEEAEHIAQELKQKVSQMNVSSVEGITLSAGVAELQADESTSKWIHRADEALYEAKEAGRNRVRSSNPPEGEPGSA